LDEEQLLHQFIRKLGSDGQTKDGKKKLLQDVIAEIKDIDLKFEQASAQFGIPNIPNFGLLNLY
jgi:hypothetical protein